MDVKWSYKLIRKIRRSIYDGQNTEIVETESNANNLKNKYFDKVDRSRADLAEFFNLYEYYDEFSLVWKSLVDESRGKISFLSLDRF